MGVLRKRLDLPFDQYQRYRIVADVIERLSEGATPLRILDVCGGEGPILNFLPEDRITILDQSDTGEASGIVRAGHSTSRRTCST